MEENLLLKIKSLKNETLVGNVVFSEEEITILKLEAQKILNKHRYNIYEIASNNISEVILLFALLVNVSREWQNKDDTFYDFLSEKAKLPVLKRSHVVDIISVLDKKNVFIINSTGNKYYSTILTHSFAPLSSLYALYDLCWTAFTRVMNKEYDERDNIEKEISRILYNKVLNTKLDNDISLGSHVYNLRAGITTLLIDHHDVFELLLKEIFSDFIKLINNQKMRDNYVSINLLERYEAKKENIKESQNILDSVKSFVSKDITKIKPIYIIENGVAKLFIPSFRVYDDKESIPEYLVYHGDKLVTRNDIDFDEDGVLLITKPIEYKLEKFIDNLKVSITYRDKTIYDSKETLFRKTILFKDGVEVLKQVCEPGIFNVFVKSSFLIKGAENNLQLIGSNVYSLATKNGDHILLNDQTIYFTSSIIEKPFLLSEHNNDVVYFQNDTLYDVLKGNIYLCLRKENINDIKIRTTYQTMLLNEFEFVLEDDLAKVNISKILKPNKINNIELISDRTNIIFSFVRFTKMRVSFDQDFYFGDNEGILALVLPEINENIKFFSSEKEILFKYKEGLLKFKIPKLEWNINGRERQNNKSKIPFWFRNIKKTDNLYINIDTHENIFVELSIGTKLSDSSGKNVFKIGEKLREKFLLANTNDTKITVFACVKETKISLFDVYYVPFFERMYSYNEKDKIITRKPENYACDSDYNFRLVISQGEETIIERNLNFNETLITLKYFSLGQYDLSVYYKNFENTINCLLCRDKIEIKEDPSEKYKGKMLMISSLKLTESKKIRELNVIYFAYDLKYVESVDGVDYLTGKIFFTHNGKNYKLGVVSDPLTKERFNILSLA